MIEAWARLLALMGKLPLQEVLAEFETLGFAQVAIMPRDGENNPIGAVIVVGPRLAKRALEAVADLDDEGEE